MNQTHSTIARIRRFAGTALVLGVALGALSACNTFHGAGKDVSAAGGAVTDASDAAKAKISNATSP